MCAYCCRKGFTAEILVPQIAGERDNNTILMLKQVISEPLSQSPERILGGNTPAKAPFSDGQSDIGDRITTPISLAGESSNTDFIQFKRSGAIHPL